MIWPPTISALLDCSADERRTAASAPTCSNSLRPIGSKCSSPPARLPLFPQARQVVRHGHIQVNGKKVTIPSTLIEVGSVISVAEASRTKKVIVEAIEMAQRRGVPPWMALEREQFRGSLRALPARAELTMPISEKLIVEHYSR